MQLCMSPFSAACLHFVPAIISNAIDLARSLFQDRYCFQLVPKTVLVHMNCLVNFWPLQAQNQIYVLRTITNAEIICVFAFAIFTSQQGIEQMSIAWLDVTVYWKASDNREYVWANVCSFGLAEPIAPFIPNPHHIIIARMELVELSGFPYIWTSLRSIYQNENYISEFL